MTDQNVEALLPLKPNWFHILLSLAGESRHGYAIMQEVGERTNGKLRLWPATLYGAIRQLEDEALVRAAGSDPEDSRRRCYKLTSRGRLALKAEVARLESLVLLARARGISHS